MFQEVKRSFETEKDFCAIWLAGLGKARKLKKTGFFESYHAVHPEEGSDSDVPFFLLKLAGTPAFLSLVTTVGYAIASGAISLSIAFWGMLVYSGCLWAGIVLKALISGKDKESINSLEAMVLGIILVSFCLLLLAFLTPFSIGINFLAILVLLAAGHLVLRRRFSFRSVQMGARDWLALLLTGIGAFLWSQGNLKSLHFEGNSVVFRPWLDILFHSRYMSLFAHSSGANDLTNPFLNGESLPLYHYGIYFIPALLVHLTGRGAFYMAAGILSPLGFIMLGLSAYLFGKSLFNERAGLVSVAGLFLIPDMSFLGLGSQWTSFFFFQEIAMNGAVSSAVLLLGWSYLIRGCSWNSFRLIFLAGFLFLICAVFKIQIAIAYSFSFAMYFILRFRKIKVQWKGLFLTFFLATCYVMGYFSTKSPEAITLAFSTDGLYSNVSAIIEHSNPVIRNLLQGIWNKMPHKSMEFIVGTAVILLTSYGQWIVIGLAAFLLRRKMEKLSPFFLFIFLVIFNHVGIATIFAPNKGLIGDPHEIIHKTFVFPYVALAVWVCSFVTLHLNGKRLIHPYPQIGVLVMILGIGVAFFCGRDTQSRLSLSKYWSNIKISIGLYECARHMASHSWPGDVVQVLRDDGRSIVAALSERKSFVAHSVFFRKSLSRIEKKRFNILKKIMNSKTYVEARKICEEWGIDWLIADPLNKLEWDKDGSIRPDFQSGGYRVYNMKRV